MTNPEYPETAKILKPIPDELKVKVEGEIKALLHASRDCYRNQLKFNPLQIRFTVNDGYYGEAFGIMRALHIMGYGYFGPVNLDALEDNYGVEAQGRTQPHQNLKWWFSELEEQVMDEEHWHGDHRCAYCLERYHKDDASLIEKGVLVPDR